jgi:hypothetical protein
MCVCVCVCFCAGKQNKRWDSGAGQGGFVRGVPVRPRLAAPRICPPPLRQSWSVHLVFSEKAIASPGDWDCGHFQVLRSIGSTVVSRSLHNSIDTLGTRTNLSIHVLDFLKKRTNHEFIQNDDDKTEQ